MIMHTVDNTRSTRWPSAEGGHMCMYVRSPVLSSADCSARGLPETSMDVSKGPTEATR
jgi:hypothetical protein